MGNSNQRDVYFRKHIQDQPTPEDYLNALASSPYRTHQRMAVLLADELRLLQASVKQSDTLPSPEDSRPVEATGEPATTLSETESA